MSSHFFGPHRLQSQHRATPGSGPSLLQAPTLPTQHSQPLPAPPTAEMPPPGVGAEPAHPRAMETEPRARPPHGSAGHTHFPAASDAHLDGPPRINRLYSGCSFFIYLFVLLRGDTTSRQLNPRKAGRSTLLLFCVIAKQVHEPTRSSRGGNMGPTQRRVHAAPGHVHTEPLGATTLAVPTANPRGSPGSFAATAGSTKLHGEERKEAPCILSGPRGPGPPIAPVPGPDPPDSPGDPASRVPSRAAAPTRVPASPAASRRPRGRRRPGRGRGGPGPQAPAAAARPLPAPQLSRLPRLNSSRPPSSFGPLQPLPGGGLRPLLQSPARPRG